jgi:hypothetical protein
MIIISRTSQISNKFVPISVFVDNSEIGSVRDGDRSEFRIPAGEHTIQARVNISVSNKIVFDLKDGRNIEFELGSNVNVMKNVLLALSHPALLVALYLLDKVIGWDYFLLFGLLAYIAFEVWIYISRRRKAKLTPETEKHYLYLKQLDDKDNE